MRTQGIKWPERNVENVGSEAPTQVIPDVRQESDIRKEAVDKSEANREQIKLSEEDLRFLSMLYDLKTKRRMSRVLLRDIVRNAQRVKLSDDEESLKAQLRTLVACKLVQWVGHYIVTNAGIAFLGESDKQDFHFRVRGRD